jgi:hypothetical protein
MSPRLDMYAFTFTIRCARSSVKRICFQFSKLHIIQSRSHSGYFKCIFMCRVCQTTSAGSLIARIQIIQAVNFLLIVLLRLFILVTPLSVSPPPTACHKVTSAVCSGFTDQPYPIGTSLTWSSESAFR